ncbi:MAG: L-threonylcarbamoyladenylate synthase [Acidimicrobiales bacterium]
MAELLDATGSTDTRTDTGSDTATDSAVERAAAALAAGKLVAFPTETVYGLGADASNAAAVANIFLAKGRPPGHPLIVHMASASDLDRFGRNVSPLAHKLGAAFWPGPLTIVVERADSVAPETAGGLDTVGLRVPDHPVTLQLLNEFGGGVAGPSANRFGSVSPTTAAHVLDDLGSVIDFVLDGGPCAVGVESTIVDVTGPVPVLLRPGGISAVEIEAVLGVAVKDGRAGPSRAPGMLASHYAPNVSVELIEQSEVDDALAVAGATGRPVGLIAPDVRGHSPSWQLPADAGGYAAQLYAALRAADQHNLEGLLVVPPRSGPLLDAVVDRLQKAAAPR